MSRHIDSKGSQLLDQSPDFGARDAKFTGNLGTADHNGCVIHEQADNAAKACVSLLRRCRNLGLPRAGWRGLRDVGIITSERNKETTLTCNHVSRCSEDVSP